MDKDVWWVAVKSLFCRRKQLSIVSYISKSKIIRHSWSYKIALEMWPVNGSLRIVYAKRGRQGVNWQDLSHRHSRDGKEITLDIHRGAHKPRAPEFAGSFWPFRCTKSIEKQRVICEWLWINTRGDSIRRHSTVCESVDGAKKHGSSKTRIRLKRKRALFVGESDWH